MHRVEGIGARRLVAHAEAGEIHGHDPEALAEPVGHPAPGHERFTVSVQHHQGRVAPAEAHRPERDVVGLEPFRRMRGLSSREPLDEAQHADQGE